MNWERDETELQSYNSRHYLGICLERLRNFTKVMSVYSVFATSLEPTLSRMLARNFKALENFFDFKHAILKEKMSLSKT